jgi:hypothetical protein
MGAVFCEGDSRTTSVATDRAGFMPGIGVRHLLSVDPRRGQDEVAFGAVDFPAQVVAAREAAARTVKFPWRPSLSRRARIDNSSVTGSHLLPQVPSAVMIGMSSMDGSVRL